MKGLTVEGLTYIFSDTGRGCSNVSFQALPGEITVLNAPSGAGKSTALAAIAGVLSRQHGSIILDEQPVQHGQAALVLQRAQIFHMLTAWENVACAWGLPVARHKDKAVQELKRYGVAEVMDSKPDQMSGGQQQRVALVSAIAQNTPLLLVDEPTSHLDEANARGVIDMLLKVAQSRIVVAASHDNRLCARVKHVVDFSAGGS